jgi:hypothetical protein
MPMNLISYPWPVFLITYCWAPFPFHPDLNRRYSQSVIQSDSALSGDFAALDRSLFLSFEEKAKRKKEKRKKAST